MRHHTTTGFSGSVSAKLSQGLPSWVGVDNPLLLAAEVVLKTVDLLFGWWGSGPVHLGQILLLLDKDIGWIMISKPYYVIWRYLKRTRQLRSLVAGPGDVFSLP